MNQLKTSKIAASVLSLFAAVLMATPCFADDVSAPQPAKRLTVGSSRRLEMQSKNQIPSVNAQQAKEEKPSVAVADSTARAKLNEHSAPGTVESPKADTETPTYGVSRKLEMRAKLH